MKSFLEKFKAGLQRTKTQLVRNVHSIFTDTGAWTDEHYDDLEASLIGSDLGVKVSLRLVEDIRDRYNRGLIETADDILAIAKAEVSRIVGGNMPPIRENSSGPTVILMVGVNGSGKTTTTGKLGKLWSDDGKSVMLAACDTFRAAATEQLKIWGERINCPVVAAGHGADAASVAYDAVKSAGAKGIDVVIIDTAGRQHTKVGLMNELAKIRRTIDKACPSAPHETWLVVDGSTGTNALSQAREFGRATELTGLCLTKLDGSGKGGVVVAIREELDLPVRFIGLGEEPDDLQPFNPDYFAEAMFSG
jgi:fused signal recognition particle receptor